jgi:hypothetical protein
MGERLTKLAIWGDAILLLLLLLLAGLEDRREIERTTPNFGLEETVGARPCVRGQRVAGVQMDGEHLLGTGGDHGGWRPAGMGVVVEEEGRGAPAGREMDGRYRHRETAIPS